MTRPLSQTVDPAARELLAALRNLRSRARWVLVIGRLALLLGAVTLGAIVLALLDAALRLPSWFRGALWLGAVGASALALWRWIGPAWRFAPRLTDLALRVERATPGLSGLLASAVDFAERGEASGLRPTAGAAPAPDSLRAHLAQGVIVRAVDACKGVRISALLEPRPAVRGVSAWGVSAAAALALLAASPGLWLIGAQRVLMPWSGASWPKRTGVVDMTRASVHALGSALPLQAAVTRSNRAWDATYVAVNVRTVRDGRAGPVRRELLTFQEKTVPLGVDPVTGAPGVGALFERLVEPAGQAIEYQFETEDDKTEWRRVALVEPPAVLGARALITPPDYARRLAQAAGAQGGAGAGAALAEARTLDLGPGTDERAVPAPMLSGSAVELTLTLNRAVEVPAEVRALFEGPSDAPQSASLTVDGATWTARWTIAQTLRLPVRLVDEHGIESLEPAVYRFEALADRPPAATITEPSSDRTVLATAVVPTTAEGRDDVGLASVALEVQAFSPAGAPGRDRSGPGGAMAPSGPAQTVSSLEASGQALARVSSEIDLRTLGVKAGDEVRLAALAMDVLTAAGPDPQPTRSPVRTLRVISESDLIREIQSQLAEVRQAAIRLDEQQAGLLERSSEGRVAAQDRREQAQVSDRLSRQGEMVERLVARVRENQLADRGLEEILGQAAGAIDEAGQASTRASRTLEDAKEAQNPDAAPGKPAGLELDEPQTKELQRAQEDVQDQLQRLIELLDRGEDNWLVRNALERLARQQRELRGQTAQAGRQTAGRSAQELTPQQQEAIDEVVREQERLADETQRLAEELRERQQALKEKDPAQAAGLSRAARRAEEQRVAQTMRQAAQSAQQNQTSRAQQQQQQAEEALQEMLEDLKQVEQARDEVLRRQLASIIESIEGLIRQQEAELDALDGAGRAGRGLDGLDRGMIALNQNTLGVQEQALAAGTEAAPISSLLGRAGDAQSLAITELRRPLLGAQGVRDHELRSLDLLKQAKAKAQELDKKAADRQQAKQMGELRKAYRELLESQVSIRQETLPLASVPELSRRDRALARALGERQGEVRDRAAQIVKTTKGLAQAKVFDYVHTRLDARAGAAQAALDQAQAQQALPAQRAVVEAIERLLEALSDPPPDPNRFSEGAQSGAGGGGGSGAGGGPLIPPVKELALLRLIQEGVAQRTRELAEAPGAGSPAELRELGDEQRELMQVGTELLDRLNQQQGDAAGNPVQGGPPDPGGPG